MGVWSSDYGKDECESCGVWCHCRTIVFAARMDSLTIEKHWQRGTIHDHEHVRVTLCVACQGALMEVLRDAKG